MRARGDDRRELLRAIFGDPDEPPEEARRPITPQIFDMLFKPAEKRRK